MGITANELLHALQRTPFEPPKFPVIVTRAGERLAVQDVKLADGQVLLIVDAEGESTEEPRATWEVVDVDHDEVCGAVLARTVVPGGWLYRSMQWRASGEEREEVYRIAESMAFVPNPGGA